MKVQGKKIEPSKWDETINEVDTKLEKFRKAKNVTAFTSPTYQLKGLMSVDGFCVLIKPIQTHFLEALNYDWEEIEIKLTEE